jgi:large subunit ribosomal protein L17
MRHRKSGRKLGRNASHRDAMFRNMVTSLIEEERIQTTVAKAKELRRVAEKLITQGGRNALSVVDAADSDADRTQRTMARVAAIRQAAKSVRNRDALQKLFGELAERFKDRPGGYTRIIRMSNRRGDNAEMAIIELLADGESAEVAETEAPDSPAAAESAV